MAFEKYRDLARLVCSIVKTYFFFPFNEIIRSNPHQQRQDYAGNQLRVARPSGRIILVLGGHSKCQCFYCNLAGQYGHYYDFNIVFAAQ
jgi:hypothetical protein